MTNEFSKTRDLKSRICFKCGRKLNFGDFFLRNRETNMEILISLWESKKLEFYCCLCYDIKMKNLEAEEIKRKLDKKSLSILKILETRYKLIIPLLEVIKYDSLGFTANNSSIDGISLFRSDISVFPKELLHLSKLKILNLAWNDIEVLPNSIYKLKSLEKINLIGNRIEKIPENLHLLPNLEECDLSFNHIESIPNNLEKSISLKLLKLIRNPIKKNIDKIDYLDHFGIKILL